MSPATAGTSRGAGAHESPRSYYGQPVIKAPVWTAEVPWYFFVGGLAGASATFADLAERTGSQRLARRAWMTALLGMGVSPALLVSDLGRPERFLNMLRMFKVTSPLSVGSWVLAVSGAGTAVAALNSATGLFPRPARIAKPLAAALGLPLSTYTGALIAQTAVPVWHEAHRELPALFGAGAAVSAGATATILAPAGQERQARRLALGGAVAELAVSALMEHRLGELAGPYREGEAGRYARLAKSLTAGGALLLGTAGTRRRPLARIGGALLLGGALAARFSVFKAGFQSARDPEYTVAPQRQRLRERELAGTGAAGPDGRRRRRGAS
jgi:formate-dependent nitrite reductase membrane component NrfD